MRVYQRAKILSHLFTAAKKTIERYCEREPLLFANNPEDTVPRTNNGMDRFLRSVKKNVRKRCANLATWNTLTQSDE